MTCPPHNKVATDNADDATNRIYEALVKAGDAALSQALNMLAIRTGENRYRHASAVVRQDRRAGRPRIDDAGEITEIKRLIASGSKPAQARYAIAKKHADVREITIRSLIRHYEKRMGKKRIKKNSAAKTLRRISARGRIDK